MGIPIVVEVLSKFGEAVEFILQNLWVVYLKLRAGCETRKKLEQPNKSFDQPIPVLFGLAISISWIILSAYFVDYAEGLSFYLSLTFTIRTITRIAPTFGKHNPTAYLFEQLFVFWIGLTLFSATIKILQSNLLNLVEMLTSDINKDYKEAQLAGESGNDPDSEAKVEKKYEKMLKSSGAILSKLLSSHDQKLVREKMEKFARLKVASVQAVPDCQDQEIDAVPVRIDQSNAIRNGFHILIDTFDNLPNKLTGGFRFPSK